MKINPEPSLSLRCRGCSAAILHFPQFSWFSCWLHCTDHWIFETRGFTIYHPKFWFWFKLWNSDGWATQESMHEQELQRLAVSPQKSCLELQPGGKSRVQSFYTLALNRSRKLHLLKYKPKCKWYSPVLTTLSPSDLQITDSETLHQLIHWWLAKSQTSAWKTSCKLLHGHFTTLIFLHSKICVLWLCSYLP